MAIPRVLVFCAAFVLASGSLALAEDDAQPNARDAKPNLAAWNLEALPPELAENVRRRDASFAGSVFQTSIEGCMRGLVFGLRAIG
jgi:hypothetical protein